jgi:hypothetical protein
MRHLLKRWPTIDRLVDQYGYWVPFLATVWGGMTWLFDHLAVVSQYGWAAVILAGIAATCVVALVISIFLIAIRYFNPLAPQAAAAVATPPPERTRPESYSPTTPLVEIAIDLNRLLNAAPWLQFHCTAYNATGCLINPTSVQGRIKIGVEEFHGQFELEKSQTTYGSDLFFDFSLKLALSTSEAAHIQKAAEAAFLSIMFLKTEIEVVVYSRPQSCTTKIVLPQTLQFETRERRVSPAFVHQVRA